MSGELLPEKAYWVGLNHVKGIGPVRMQALLSYFGSAYEAWIATREMLHHAGLGPTVINSLHEIRQNITLDDVWADIHTKGITVCTWEDSNYPSRLKEIEKSPPVLYIRGSITRNDSWAVAVVGTRKMTSYGKQVTQEVSRALARNGITVVSGLARGVDGTAHRSALDAGGRTLAVLGCGVDRVYPPEHRKLAEATISNGALISDYSPGTPPDGINFPPRNRIISALSLAVIVIEASKRSGALITAAFAAEQGREVFSVPGNIYAPQSKGSNILVQQGARVLLNVQDVLETMNLAMVNEHREARQVLPSDKKEAALYKVLSDEPHHVDEIHKAVKLPIDEVSSTLALMELKGLVRHVGGMKYVAVHEEDSKYEIGE